MKIKLNQTLILESVNGPWDLDMHGSAEVRNLTNAASRENFKTNPLQYFTNWYLRGPLQHLSSEMYGKIAEMLYSLLKHTESKPITSVGDFQKELAKLDGPWNKEKEAMRLGFDKMDKTLTEIKNKHFMHWLFNPFIKGELNSTINYHLRENLQLELNKYGNGKGDQLNSEAVDSTRTIEHKRYLDKMAKALPDKEATEINTKGKVDAKK